MMRRLAFALLLSSAAAGCSGGDPASAAPAASATPGEEEPLAAATPKFPEEAEPRVSVVVRAGLAPGRPVPYRLTLENRTRDVVVPVLVEATDGTGGAFWGRTVAGEVVYDEDLDRFVETPVYTVQVAGITSADHALLRSAIFPGDSLVQEFDVRYGHTGAVADKLRIKYHRLSPGEFESRCYVGSGDSLPRRYAPLGHIQDRSARRGALLAGFYLRTEKPMESAVGEISLTLPALPPAIATRITKAGFEPDRAMAADWAGGWLAGDGERSVLVTSAGATRPLPGVPFDALQVIDDAGTDVSFCVNGAKRDEIAPFFPGREIVPYKCLHVSVPRKDIFATLERITTAGFTVTPVDFQAREALDVKRSPVAKGTPKPMAGKTPGTSPVPSPTAKPAKTPAKTATPSLSPTETPASVPAETPAPAPTETPG